MLVDTSIPATHLALTAGVLLVVAFVFTTFVLPSFSAVEKYLSSTPWVGRENQIFGRFRAGMRFLTNSRVMLKEGYEKYNKQGKLFVLPQFSTEPLVVLPADKMTELINLSDDQVDPHIVNQESIATYYTTGTDVSDGPHIDVVRRQLTRRLPLLTNDVYDELVLAMHDQWRVSEKEWSTVKPAPTCMKIVSRAANRVFSGKELCRNPEFLEHSRLYSQSVFVAGAKIRLFPKWTHPIVARYFVRDVKYHKAICTRIALPIIRKRLRILLGQDKKPADYEEPVDALQWVLEDCVKLSKQDPTELNEDRLMRRLLLLNMVAIHTTSMVTANTILDLFSSENREEYVAGLREEVERVLRESGGEWSKNAINSMHRIDSTIRETMRYSSLGDAGIRRMIMAKEGVTLSGGIHLPYGTRVVASTHSIHTDPAFYGNDANTWNPFRFSAPREAYLERVTAAGGDPDRLKTVLEQKNQNLIATGEDFLSFGHGRHACPGRFFATQEMKLMIAHIVSNYDIKIEGGRPKNPGMNGAYFPDPEAAMQIRLLPAAQRPQVNRQTA